MGEGELSGKMAFGGCLGKLVKAREVWECLVNSKEVWRCLEKTREERKVCRR
jgi:hypothetical protein